MYSLIINQNDIFHDHISLLIQRSDAINTRNNIRFFIQYVFFNIRNCVSQMEALGQL